MNEELQQERNDEYEYEYKLSKYREENEEAIQHKERMATAKFIANVAKQKNEYKKIFYEKELSRLEQPSLRTTKEHSAFAIDEKTGEAYIVYYNEENNKAFENENIEYIEYKGFVDEFSFYIK